VINVDSAEEAGYFFQGPLSGGEADALNGFLDESFQALEREREMRAALGGDEGVNLVDDNGFDGAEGFGSLRGEQQVERLGGGDENVGWLAGEAGALALGGVAGADADRRLVEGHAHAASHVRHADQR
jgi:hypothetical protein